MSRRLFFNIFNLVFEGAVWRINLSSLLMRGHVLTNLWLCFVRLPEQWPQSPGFGADERVLELPVVPGIPGGEHGHHIPGWSQDAAGWVHATHRRLAALPGPIV